MKEPHPFIRPLFQLIIEVGAAGGQNALQNAGVQGVTQAYLDRLARMTTLELNDFCEINLGVIKTVIMDASLLDIMFNLYEARQQDHADQVELIRRGASLPLMEAEFGIGGAEYAALRRGLNIDNNGRPPKLSEEDELRVLRIWQETQHLPSRQRWLAIGRADIPLNSAWTLIQQEKVEREKAGGESEDEAPLQTATLKRK
jgi:hypothetical protein